MPHKESVALSDSATVSISPPIETPETVEVTQPEYTSPMVINKGKKPINRLFIATPARGIVRMEWAIARFGQIIPCNWSQSLYYQAMNIFAPIGYGIADAQNLCVSAFLRADAEWLLLHEDDVILPPNAFVTLNQYLRSGDIPIVSGLYFTKSNPAEPLIYRGKGNSYYDGWKIGDKVWCDGVPTGILLMHRSILEVLWEEAPEYIAEGIKVKKVFDFPEKVYYDPQDGALHTATGTSDLDMCVRLKTNKVFEKAGWPKYQEMEFPLLVDTAIFCKHIDQDGLQYPLGHKGW